MAAYAKERPDEPQRRRDCVYFQFRNSRVRVNDLLHNLRGMVWSFCLSSKAELQEMSDECLIGNVIQNDRNIQVRVVSHNKPHKNAVSLPPTMEDLYLFYFQGGDTH